MKHLGDIELIGGVIKSLRGEEVTSDPTFSSTDEAIIIYNSTTKELKFNNGSAWVTIESNALSASTILRSSLGSEWIEPNLSFSPTNFNLLNNISGLTSNDNLFSVLSQLDTAITDALTVVKLQGVSLNFTSGLTNGDIIYFDGTEFIPGTLNDLAIQNITVEELNDVSVASLNTNEILSFNGTNWINKPLIYRFDNLTGLSNTFTVTHNLGTQYCGVTIIDRSTTPPTKIVESLISSIEFTNTTSLKVTLTQSKPVTIIVAGMALS